MVVNEIHGNVLMHMLSVTYNTHTSRIIILVPYRLLRACCGKVPQIAVVVIIIFSTSRSWRSPESRLQHWMYPWRR